MRGFSHERRGVPWLAIPTFLYKRSTIWNLASAEVPCLSFGLACHPTACGVGIFRFQTPEPLDYAVNTRGGVGGSLWRSCYYVARLQQNSKRERSHREPSVYFAVFLQAPTGRTASER